MNESTAEERQVEMTIHPEEIEALKKAGKVYSVCKPQNSAFLPGAYCHLCDRSTPTALIPLSSGHVANACANCKTCRKQRPYATKTEYLQALKAASRRAEGDNEATKAL